MSNKYYYALYDRKTGNLMITGSMLPLFWNREQAGQKQEMLGGEKKVILKPVLKQDMDRFLNRFIVDTGLDMPQVYLDKIGTRQTFRGPLFNKDVEVSPKMKYEVLDVRFGTGNIYQDQKPKHPTIQYLLAGGDRKKPQWTRPIACREINL
jgi:hypothetical protein